MQTAFVAVADVKRKGFRQWRLEFDGPALARGVHFGWLGLGTEGFKLASFRIERRLYGSNVMVEAEVRGDSGVARLNGQGGVAGTSRR